MAPDFNFKRICVADDGEMWLSRGTKIALFVLGIILLVVSLGRADTWQPATCYPDCDSYDAWVDWQHVPATAHTYTGDSTTMKQWDADVYGPGLSGELDIKFDFLAFSQNPDDPYDVYRMATSMAAQDWASITDSWHADDDPSRHALSNPEPSSWLLMASGFLGLMWMIRRPRRMPAAASRMP